MQDNLMLLIELYLFIFNRLDIRVMAQNDKIPDILSNFEKK
jgi:hypothetical protein